MNRKQDLDATIGVTSTLTGVVTRGPTPWHRDVPPLRVLDLDADPVALAVRVRHDDAHRDASDRAVAKLLLGPHAHRGEDRQHLRRDGAPVDHRGLIPALRAVLPPEPQRSLAAREEKA